MTSLPVLGLLSGLAAVTMALSSSSTSTNLVAPVLVVGASGGTGGRALSGLLDSGFSPRQIRILSRNPAKLEKWNAMGFDTCQADLDDVSSLPAAIAGCKTCYVHSTSSDTTKLDTGEEERARNLATAIQSSFQKLGATTSAVTIQHVVYNSAAGEVGHGVKRIEQKHSVEKVFRNEFPDIPFTSLRANLFMEELWKGYTRKGILKGTFPFSVPSNRPLYLTCVQDMGRLAGACLQAPETTVGRIINVAGDVLTASEIADAFAKAQNSPCVHKEAHLFALFCRLFFRDLFEIIQFYRRSTETTDIGALQSEFPGQLTSFSEFLEETNWGQPELTFDDLSVVKIGERKTVQ